MTTNTALLVGYFGYENVGDEWLKAKAQSLLSAIYPDITVVEGSKKQPMTLLKSLLKSDLVVFPGGSLLQNSTSNKSLMYYAGVAILAKILRKKVWFLAQGIGPLKGKYPTLMATLALKGADHVSVRDEAAGFWLSRNGIQANQYADLVYMDAIYKESYNGEAPLGLSLRPHELLPIMKGQLRQFFNQQEALPIFVSCQKGTDLSFSEKHKSVELMDVNEHNPLEISGLIGMRYHACVWASLHGVPFIAIGSDPKLIELAKLCQQPYWDLSHGAGREMRESIKVFVDNKHVYQARLKAAVADLIQAANRIKQDLQDGPG